MAFAEFIQSGKEVYLADYSNFYPNPTPAEKFFNLFIHPAVPILSVLGYLLLSAPVFEWIRVTFGVQPKGSMLQTITILHSLALAIYSGWTFWGAFNLLRPVYEQRGLYGMLCDSDNYVWDTLGFSFWVTHFYISKYYEFIDTWIIHLKGRHPMFLQTYHHAGIVILAWAFVATKCTAGGVVLVVFNSFIHTLMYTYYVFAALGVNSPLKHYLTQAQITQFFVGGGITLSCCLRSGCLTPQQRFSLHSIHLYLVVLIYLFIDFYIKSYTKKGDGKKGGDKAGKGETSKNK